MKILLLSLFCTFFFWSNATKVMYKDCGSTGMIKMIDISPCASQPCELKINTNVTVTIDFVAKMPTNDLTAVLMGVISGIPIPQPLPNPNACECGVKCPVKAGADNRFKEVVYIESDFPTVHLQSQLELKDDKFNKVVCALVPIIISE